MEPGLLGFVLRSKQRRKIMDLLQGGKTPTEIAYLANVSVAHTSRTLKEFCDKKLAECENPKKRMNKIYKLTTKGVLILEKLKK